VVLVDVLHAIDQTRPADPARTSKLRSPMRCLWIRKRIRPDVTLDAAWVVESGPRHRRSAIRPFSRRRDRWALAADRSVIAPTAASSPRSLTG